MVATRADGAHRTHRRQQQEREPCGARQRRHGQAARLHDDHGRQVKLGITVVAALSVTTQLPVPGQPPPIQPIKVELGCAAALSITLVPAANALTQVAPQRIPDGMLAMRPLPVPDRVTVSRSLAVLVKVQVMLRAFPTAVAAMLTVPEVTLLTVANTTFVACIDAAEAAAAIGEQVRGTCGLSHGSDGVFIDADSPGAAVVCVVICRIGAARGRTSSDAQVEQTHVEQRADDGFS